VSGCPDVRLVDSRLVSLLCAVVTMGSLRPNTMLARKAEVAGPNCDVRPPLRDKTQARGRKGEAA
jgi:hypothetical protein